MSLQVVCNYCREDAELVEKETVYSQGYGGKVWLCRPCRAWVGADSTSPVFAPLGTLAKSQLRAKRVHALAEFDRVWRLFATKYYGWSGKKARSLTYGWLARQMCIPLHECNIYAFDEVKTQIAIEICKAVQIVQVAA